MVMIKGIIEMKTLIIVVVLMSLAGLLEWWENSGNHGGVYKCEYGNNQDHDVFLPGAR